MTPERSTKVVEDRRIFAKQGPCFRDSGLFQRFLESPQVVEKQGGSNYFLEILELLETPVIPFSSHDRALPPTNPFIRKLNIVAQHNFISVRVGVFGRTDFSQIFMFGPPDLFFVAG